MIKQANNIYKERSYLVNKRVGVTKMGATKQTEVLQEYKKIREILELLEQFKLKIKPKKFTLDIEEIRKNARKSLAATTLNGNKYD